MKRRILFLLLYCLLLFPLSAEAYAAPDLSSQAACVVEMQTGRILYAKNADTRLPMASTTKVMTALLVVEAGNLDKVVTIPDQAVGVEGSSLYLKKGEQFTRRSLLYALMLASGNDVATALAIDVSGSVQDFIVLMNARARQIGAGNTHFDNPHGLPSKQHYTTAHDLALIAAVAMRNPDFCAIVGTKSIVIEPQTVGIKRTLSNHNKLLWQFQGACGIKTGFTKEAGRCLVGAAKRDGKSVVAVVLNAPDMWKDVCTLMGNSLNSLECITLRQNGEVIGPVAVKNGLETTLCGVLSKDVAATVTKEEQKRIQIQIYMPRSVTAPVNAGGAIGQVSVSLDGLCLCEADIVADRQVNEKTFLHQLLLLLRRWVGCAA